MLQLGEQPERIFLVGGLGVDNIKRLNLLDRESLEATLDFRLAAKSLLVTYHPVTLEHATAAVQMTELLSALEVLTDTSLIFTMPNADPDGRAIRQLIESFVSTHANARAYISLGQVRYLSCVQQVDGVVGNSSSGLAEVPSFRKGTINIGDRQLGRLKAESVIDCEPTRPAISAALQRLYSSDFQKTLRGVRNPYGEGGASEKVVRVLGAHPLEGLLRKSAVAMVTNCQEVRASD